MDHPTAADPQPLATDPGAPGRVPINPQRGGATQHFELAMGHQARHEAALAIAHYRKALQLQPDLPLAWSNLGALHHGNGAPHEAVACYEHALRLQPNDAATHTNLALALCTLQRYDEAHAHARLAAALQPESAQACIALGLALENKGRPDEAIRCFEAARDRQPRDARIHYQLGVMLQERGRADEAIASYQQAIACDGDHAQAWGNLLFNLSTDARCTPERYLQQAKEYGRRLQARCAPYTDWEQPERGSPLRLGLVSGDLRNHPVGLFLEGWLRHHDRKALTLVAYPTLTVQDDLSARIRPHFSAWRPLEGCDDAQAAQRIHDDRIQILIDLSGHTRGSRLAVFARKPAPVQVSWLGYWASTGLPGMDYLLADPACVPTFHHDHFSERIEYLPHTRFCFTPPAQPIETGNDPPSARNGFLTLGCFQRYRKITPQTIALWGGVLQRLPNARLYLQNVQTHQAAARQELLHQLGAAGIAAQRVQFAPYMPRDAYLAAYRNVDFLLDTEPFTGGTTTCEALWMGVPTLTRLGDRLVSRQGASLLMQVGLHDWVADSERDYIEKAVRFAHDMPYLRQLRTSLRERMRASPLCDAATFAKDLEQLLLRLWRRHAQFLPGGSVRESVR